MKQLCCDASHISDYVLDLLSSNERERVALHLSTCGSCRDAADDEAQAVREVRLMIRGVVMPNEKRLRDLMPAVPDHRRSRWTLAIRQQVAPMLALLAILLSSWFSQAATAGPATGSISTPPVRPPIVSGAQAAETVPTYGVNEKSALFTITAEAPAQQEIAATPAPHPPPTDDL